VGYRLARSWLFSREHLLVMRDVVVLWGAVAGVAVGSVGIGVAVGTGVAVGLVGDEVIRAASVGLDVGVKRLGLDVPPTPEQPAAVNKKPTIKHLSILFMVYL